MTGDVLATWGPPVLSLVFAGGIGGVLKVMFDRKLTNASAGKTAVEGEVAASADYRAWAERADKRAERAEARLDAAEQAARDAKNKAAQLEIELGNARDELEDVHKRLDRLIEAIRGCGGGTAGCPVAASVQPPAS